METYLTTKGRITLPASLRRKYGIKPGTRILVTEIDGLILLQPMTERYFKRLQGSLKGTGALKTLMDERCIEKG